MMVSKPRRITGKIPQKSEAECVEFFKARYHEHRKRYDPMWARWAAMKDLKDEAGGWENIRHISSEKLREAVEN